MAILFNFLLVLYNPTPVHSTDVSESSVTISELVSKKVKASYVGNIQPINHKTKFVAPLLYHEIGDFSNLPIEEKKDKFIAAVLPAILVAKHRIETERNQVLALSQKEKWTIQDAQFFQQQSEKYGTDKIEVLLDKMMVHPTSIVLAQAIVESGWGTSRFFLKANNLFGVWSFNPDEPRIPAKYRRKDSGLQAYLRKYDDISESIQNYFETIARTNAYKSFVNARTQTDNVSRLLPYLRNYSERKEAYIAQLQSIINHNDLTQYDQYHLDPNYFIINIANAESFLTAANVGSIN